MIQFPCKCGHPLKLPDDEAGGLTQCPRCGLLVDVPTVADLAHLSADGTIKLHDAPAESSVHSPQALAEMHVAFSPQTTDRRGIEKDLRPDEEFFRRVGDPAAPDDAAAVYARPSRPAPRYDPVTGERIRPLELKDEAGHPAHAPQPVIPVVPLQDGAGEIPGELVAIPVRSVEPVHPVQPVKSISYATYVTRGRAGPGMLALELLMPANVVVMFFGLIGYIAAGLMTYALWVGSSLIGIVSLQVLNLPLWLVLAHYGCVIEDTGPEAKDELPRPLRNFSLGDDIINPAIWWAIALLLCYWPALLLAAPRVPLDPQLRPILVGALALGGSLFLPAVLLTTVAGSTLENLRPDRVLGVMYRCGPEYIISIGAFLLAAVSAAMFLILPLAMPGLLHNPVLARLRKPYLFMPLLTVSVYIGHYFAWHLGAMYREYHDNFPWVLQRHVSTRRR